MSTAGVRIDDAQGGCFIRPLVPDDAMALFDAVSASMPELSRWQDWASADYSIDSARAFIDDSCAQWAVSLANREFGIFDTQREQLVGCVGINQINPGNRFANLGYWVCSSHTGLGVATRAAQLAVRFGFEHLGLNRLEIVVLPDNLRSRRVAEKLGARCEGLLANRLMFRQQAHDALMFCLTPAA